MSTVHISISIGKITYPARKKVPEWHILASSPLPRCALTGLQILSAPSVRESDLYLWLFSLLKIRIGQHVALEHSTRYISNVPPDPTPIAILEEGQQIVLEITNPKGFTPMSDFEIHFAAFGVTAGEGL